MKRKYLLYLFLLLFIFASCHRFQSSIPNMPVHLERNLNTINCLFPGDCWRITSCEKATDRIGYGGVMLVCAFDNTYYAFDLSCPVEAANTVRVGVPDDMLLVKCPKCGEVYDLSFGMGTPTLGISDEALLRYTVNLLINNNVYIQN